MVNISAVKGRAGSTPVCARIMEPWLVESTVAKRAKHLVRGKGNTGVGKG